LDQDFKNENYEIIVVDNGSTDQSAAIIKRFPVFYCYEEEPSSYMARNRGASLAKGNILAFVDSDVVVDFKWLMAGIDCLQTSEIALSKIETLNSNNKILYLLDSIILNPYRELKFKRDNSGFIGIFFCKKSAFNAIGGFDESLISGGDTIFGLSAKNLGYRIKFANNAIVYHPVDGFKKRIAKSYRLAFGGEAKSRFQKKQNQKSRKNKVLESLVNQKIIIIDYWSLIQNARSINKISIIEQYLLIIISIVLQFTGFAAIILNRILRLNKKRIARW